MVFGTLAVLLAALADFGDRQGAPRPLPDFERDHDLCIIVYVSGKPPYDDRARAVLESWADESTYFLTNETEPFASGFRFRPKMNIEGHTIRIPAHQSGYEYLAEKTLFLFRHLYEARQLRPAGRSRGQKRLLCKWYMKVDDDTFVNVAGVKQRLACFDSARPLLLGSIFNVEERGVDVDFAQGGTGYILSRGALEAIGPYLSSCAAAIRRVRKRRPSDELMEDVELTRCVRERIHVNPMRLGSFFRDFVSHDSFSDMKRTLARTQAAPNATCALTWHKVSASQMRYISRQLAKPSDGRSRNHPSCELERANKEDYGRAWHHLATCKSMRIV